MMVSYASIIIIGHAFSHKQRRIKILCFVLRLYKDFGTNLTLRNLADIIGSFYNIRRKIHTMDAGDSNPDPDRNNVNIFHYLE